MVILALDGGTTNTRVRLWKDGKILDTVSAHIGSSSEDRSVLEQTVSEMIQTLLQRNQQKEQDVTAVLAIGMITSEFGLYELAHTTAPAGFAEFASAAKTVSLPQITSIPFFFIPGLKNNTAEPDMMRGEETECLGLCRLLDIHRPVAVILPGTHNKLIHFDGERITSCATMMSGEMIAAVSEHTLLRHTLPHPLPKTFDRDGLLEGANYCRKFGFTDAALRVRSIGKYGNRTPEWLSSYFVGAVLYCDMISIQEKSQGLPLVLGGTDPLKSELAYLAETFLNREVIVASAEQVNQCTVVGSVEIFQQTV